MNELDKLLALREGAENAAVEEYFNAWPPLDNWMQRDMFAKGFQRGWTAGQQYGYVEAVKTERKYMRDALMAMHEKSKGHHNYYHCAAVEIFGEEKK